MLNAHRIILLFVTVLQAVKVALLLAVLPAISRILRGRDSADTNSGVHDANEDGIDHPSRRSSRAADLTLARATALIMAAGWTMIGLAPTATLAALGMLFAAATTPAFFFIRCVLTSLVPAQHVARVYAVIALFDTVGSMSGGAVVAGLFERGMELAPLGAGLPWFFFGILGLLTAAVLFAVRLSPDERIGAGYDEMAEAAYAGS